MSLSVYLYYGILYLGVLIPTTSSADICQTSFLILAFHGLPEITEGGARRSWLLLKNEMNPRDYSMEEQRQPRTNGSNRELDYLYLYGYKYLIPHLEISSSALPLSFLSWIDPVYHRLALCNASSYILFILSFIIYYLLLWLLEENGVPIHTACNKQIHALTLSESHQFPNRKHPARRSLGLPPIGIYCRCQISAFLLTAHPVIVPLGLTRVVTDHLGAVS